MMNNNQPDTRTKREILEENGYKFDDRRFGRDSYLLVTTPDNWQQGRIGASSEKMIDIAWSHYNNNFCMKCKGQIDND